MIEGNYLLLFDGDECKALYQIKKDPFQKNNLLKQEVKQANKMLSTLKNWIQNKPI